MRVSARTGACRRTRAPRPVGEGMSAAGGVDPPVGRQPAGGEHPVEAGQGPQLGDPVGTDDLEGDADRVGHGPPRVELVDPLGGGGEAEAAAAVVADVDAGVGFKTAVVELDAGAQQLHQLQAAVVLGAQAGGVPGGAARELVGLEHGDVGAAEPGEVVGDAATGDAAADDRNLHTCVHRSSGGWGGRTGPACAAGHSLRTSGGASKATTSPAPT